MTSYPRLQVGKHYHEDTDANGEATCTLCPLQESEAEGLCTQCGFERDLQQDQIADFVESEMLTAELIASTDQFLRARFSNDGLSEIREIFENGVFDFATGNQPNLNGYSQWTSMRICWLYSLSDEIESYTMANRTPHEGLLEYLMACVLLCSRMIDHHSPSEASNS